MRCDRFARWPDAPDARFAELRGDQLDAASLMIEILKDNEHTEQLDWKLPFVRDAIAQFPASVRNKEG